MGKIAIMQPYFMPYLGYFSLIKHTDAFILLDEVQFIYHGWIERNRILKPNGEWQYIAVPLQKHGRNTLIKDIQINNIIPWKEKMLAQLHHYKKASHYKEVVQLLEELFACNYESIAKLNAAALKAVCVYLGIERDFPVFSEMKLAIEPPTTADEWALNICTALGNVDEYWNPEGGMAFFDKNKYESVGIALRFLRQHLPPYPQKGPMFISGLSILDVMMTNSKNEIHTMLDDFELVK